jgi:hypothetical protein
VLLVGLGLVVFGALVATQTPNAGLDTATSTLLLVSSAYLMVAGYLIARLAWRLLMLEEV